MERYGLNFGKTFLMPLHLIHINGIHAYIKTNRDKFDINIIIVNSPCNG